MKNKYEGGGTALTPWEFELAARRGDINLLDYENCPHCRVLSRKGRDKCEDCGMDKREGNK